MLIRKQLKLENTLIEQSPCYEVPQYNSHVISKAGNALIFMIRKIARFIGMNKKN